MKTHKWLLPFLLLMLLTICSCSSAKQSEVEDVIAKDLNLLKNVDSDTTAMYINELSPDSSASDLPETISDVFTLFFQNFDYKILDTDIDTKNGTATSKIRIKTLDAAQLAKDFAAEHLNTEIIGIANNTQNMTDYDSLEQRYLLLYQLLTSKDYDTVEIDSSVTLKKDSNDQWSIQRSYSLENDLVGGLMTYLSDPGILSPDETLSIYLDSIKNMDENQLKNYLGIDSLFTNNDTEKLSIANAIIGQIHNTFDYEIGKYEINGYTATVPAVITTFNSDSIIAEYQKKLDEYLATPEAVIDGATVRHQKALEYLTEAIRNNDKTTENEVVFHLINDGTTWHLEDNSTELGNAILGTIISSEYNDGLTNSDSVSESDDDESDDSDSDDSIDSYDYDYSDDEY